MHSECRLPLPPGALPDEVMDIANKLYKLHPESGRHAFAGCSYSEALTVLETLRADPTACVTVEKLRVRWVCGTAGCGLSHRVFVQLQ